MKMKRMSKKAGLDVTWTVAGGSIIGAQDLPGNPEEAPNLCVVFVNLNPNTKQAPFIQPMPHNHQPKQAPNLYQNTMQLHS